MGSARLVNGLKTARASGADAEWGGEGSAFRPGSLAMAGIALNGPGGKFSWVSQLVSTSRPIRSGWRVTSTWDIAPPLSLPTIVTSSRSSASRKLAIVAAIP